MLLQAGQHEGCGGIVSRIVSPVTFIAESDRNRWLNRIIGMAEGVLIVEDGVSTIRLRCYASVNEMIESGWQTGLLRGIHVGEHRTDLTV